MFLRTEDFFLYRVLSSSDRPWPQKATHGVEDTVSIYTAAAETEADLTGEATSAPLVLAHP